MSATVGPVALAILAMTLGAPAAANAQALFTEPVGLSEPLVTTADFAINGASQHWLPDAFDDDGDAITRRDEGPGSFAHYDPTDPAGTYVIFNASFYTQRPPNVVRSLGGWAMSFDHAGIWFTGSDDERAELKLVVDGDYAGAQTYEYHYADFPDWGAMYALLGVDAATLEPAPGTLCFRTKRLVHCADLAAGTLEVTFDAAVIDEVVGPLPELEGTAASELDPTTVAAPDLYAPLDWVIDDVQFVPDGRLFVLATGARNSYVAIHTVRALLEVASDGAVSIRYGPLKTHGDVVEGGLVAGPATDPLGGGDTLLYLPAYDAVAVHTTGASYGWSAVRGVEGIIHFENSSSVAPHGWQGHGLHLFPLEAPGHGLLDLTDAIIRRLRCAEGGTALGCRIKPPRLLLDRGELRVLVMHVPTYNNFNNNYATLHALAYDPGRLDLDGDGLTAAAEAAAGTSDYLCDSDGGGSDDQDEVLRAGTDPARAGDDPVAALRHASPVTLVSSPMIRVRLPEEALANGPGMVSWAASGPLCENGVCYAATGDVVLEYGDLAGLDGRFPPVRSVDGGHLVVPTADGLARVFLDDGHREGWLATDEVLAAFPRAPGAGGPLLLQHLIVIPVDARRTWVVNEQRPARVVLFEDRTPRVVYDHEQARCDSGLGDCDPGPFPSAPDLDQTTGGGLPGSGLPYGDVPHHDVEEDRLVFVGYEPRGDRVMVGVYGTWQTYLVALHGAAPPLLMATERELMAGGGGARYVDSRRGPPRLPTGWLPLKGDVRLTDVGYRDPLGAPIAGSIEWFHAYGAPMSGWGDTTLYRVYAGAPEDGRYELVRYGAALEPNDVVVASWGETSPKDDGYRPECPVALRVYHGKARGGLVERIKRCVPSGGPTAVTSGSLVAGVVGVDVTAAGALCIADGARVVTFTGTASTGGFPQVPLWDVPLAGVVACAWDGAGRLVALTAAPAQVHVFDPASEAGFGVAATLSAPADATVARGFLRLPDGEVVVVFEGVPGEDGGAVVRRALALDGGPVDVAARGAAAGVIAPAMTWEPGLRSDGFVITQAAGRLRVTDLFSGREAPFAWESFGDRGNVPTQMAFAVVPGGQGDRRDPWTGQLRTASRPNERGPVTAPANDEAVVGDGGDPGGCGAAPGGERPLPVLLLALGLGALWRRRRYRQHG